MRRSQTNIHYVASRIAGYRILEQTTRRCEGEAIGTTAGPFGWLRMQLPKSIIIDFTVLHTCPRSLDAQQRTAAPITSLTLSNSFSAFVAPRRFCSRADLSAMAPWAGTGLLLAVGMAVTTVCGGQLCHARNKQMGTNNLKVRGFPLLVLPLLLSFFSTCSTNGGHPLVRLD